MHKIATFLLPLALALPVTAAAEGFDPEARSREIAPFLDAQTIALAHLDLTRVDLEGLVAAVTDIAHLEAEEVTPFKQTAQQWIADFKKAGGKEAYLAASLDDLPQHLTLIIPTDNDESARAIQQLLGGPKSTELAQYLPLPFGIEIIERLDGAIFAGSKAALARLRAGRPAPRPEAAEAFAAAGDTVAQLLLLPTADLRRVIEEILPALPPAVGDGPSTTLTHGLVWAALGANGPPKASLRLVIQSQDGAAAQSFATWLTNAYQALGQDKGLRRLAPNLDKVRRLPPPQVTADQLTLTLDPADRETVHVLAAWAPLLTHSIRRERCVQNLRQIGLALHTYHDVHGKFPPQANHDAQGKPLLSWRVHILPYLGDEKLYKEFHLDEPWDSEHNKKLIARMPAVYRCPSMKRSLKNETTYLGPVHASAMFTGTAEGVLIKDVTDGTSNTIFVVDANDDHAVIWTKPEDWKLEPTNPQKGLVGHHDGLMTVLFVDGAVRFLPDTLDPKTLLAYFTRNGGEVVP
jgi:hypothetical protein